MYVQSINGMTMTTAWALFIMETGSGCIIESKQKKLMIELRFIREEHYAPVFCLTLGPLLRCCSNGM